MDITLSARINISNSYSLKKPAIFLVTKLDLFYALLVPVRTPAQPHVFIDENNWYFSMIWLFFQYNCNVTNSFRVITINAFPCHSARGLVISLFRMNGSNNVFYSVNRRSRVFYYFIFAISVKIPANLEMAYPNPPLIMKCEIGVSFFLQGVQTWLFLCLFRLQSLQA